MVLRWKITFPALHGEEERTAYVYLPASYDAEPEKRYPVLYMFDGHNVFFDTDATYGKSWGMAEYLDRTGTELIVAGVECDHDPDHGRIKEYSPYDFKNAEFGSIRGRGKETAKWFIEVFKKEVDSRWRTLPDRANTFIGGSSMGGLMSLYTVLAHNDVFSGAAALSPSLWTDIDSLKKLAETAKLQPDTVIYMDYGAVEMGSRRGMRRDFGEMTGCLMQRKIGLTVRIVPKGEHCEASWEKQLPFAIETLLYQQKEG